MSVRYFDDSILLTETHAWAYYRLPTHAYEFTTPAEREALAINITVAMAAIRLPEAEVHLRVAHRSYPAAQWAARLDATSDGGPGWRDYLDEMYRHVWAKDFWSKEVYLGVRLGQRGMRAQLSGGMFSQFINAYRASEQALGLHDEAVSAAEIAKWTDQAERLGRALSGSTLRARHATADEIDWLFRHALSGTAGDPPGSAVRRRTWGAGEIEALLEGQVHNGRTLLHLEQPEAARMLEHGITKERLPFVYGWHRLSVAAPTRELCQRRVEALVEHYRDIGIDVVNSTGDQFSLLRESLPGERVHLSSYVQRQPLYTIAGGVPTATVALGDMPAGGTSGHAGVTEAGEEDLGWVGPYIGETMGRARSIVHFDPLLAAVRNRPTAVAITGEPGGGKTTLALLLIMQLALRGVTIAVIDPKGDVEPLVDVLQARGRKARVLPLGSAAPGLLDPFSFGAELAARRTMATETLRLLLPRMSEERESAMIQAVAAVAAREKPSLGGVVRHLEASADPASKNLGAVLHSMSEMRLARLCFSPTAGQRIDAEGWTTVFTLAGLTLPDASVNREDFSYEQRLSVALLYLVSQFARRLLNGMDRRAPKAIFLDEAWAVTSTPEGAKLVPEVSRMGRSRNTALILVSQNAGDLLSEQVTNCISSVFAFRSSERVEVANVMALLGVEASAEHQAVLRGQKEEAKQNQRLAFLRALIRIRSQQKRGAETRSSLSSLQYDPLCCEHEPRWPKPCSNRKRYEHCGLPDAQRSRSVE